MTEYVCPNCRGGFPEPDQNHCPWCGQELGEYEPPTHPLQESITSVEETDESEERGILDFLR
jgi:hypothetical protein